MAFKMILPNEIWKFIEEINKYRTGYGKLSKIVNRIQTQFEKDFERVTMEFYRKVNTEMSAVENIEELRGTEYPHLRVLTGGKGPPEGPTDNWLATLEVGTTFVSKSNSSDIDYNLYYILYLDLPEVVLLKWQLPDGKVLDYYVHPELFSKKFPKYKILSIIKPKELQQEAEETEDGNSDRTDPT